MKFIRAVILTVSILLLIGCAMAEPAGLYVLEGSSHSGTAFINGDGTGTASVSGYPFDISFSYTASPDGTSGIAYYGLVESVPFVYDPINDVYTSPDYPGIELVNATFLTSSQQQSNNP
jgi:hypothetical protein